MVLAFPAAPGGEKPYRELIRKTWRARDSIRIEFAEPFEARAVTVFPAFSGRFLNVALEASDDGVAHRRVTTVSNPGRHLDSAAWSA